MCFMGMKEKFPSAFRIFWSKRRNLIAANVDSTGLTPLFYLIPPPKGVTIPERPYLRPAVSEALGGFDDRFEHFLKTELAR